MLTKLRRYPSKFIEKLHEHSYIMAARACDAFVVLTKSEKEYQVKERGVDARIISNFQSVNSVKKADMQCREVIAVGRLVEQKNFSDLLDI